MASNKKSGRFTRRVVAITATIITVLFFAFFIVVFGSVEGVEFSPTHFETRNFSVYEIPVLKIQVTPIHREAASQSNTVRYLYAQSYLRKPAGSPTDWHLVQLSRSGLGAYEADAKLLTKHLELSIWNSSTGGPHWEEWSKQNAALAKVLWPVIQRLALRELYILMPPIFELAVNADSDVELDRQISQYLRTSYAELITEMRSAKQQTIADELLKEALYDYPTDPALLKLK